MGGKKRELRIGDKCRIKSVKQIHRKINMGLLKNGTLCKVAKFRRHVVYVTVGNGKAEYPVDPSLLRRILVVKK